MVIILISLMNYVINAKLVIALIVKNILINAHNVTKIIPY